MKKLLALLLVFALLASFGCAKKENEKEEDGNKISITAAEVCEKLVAATEKINDVKTVSNMSFTADIAMDSDGMSFDMSFSSKITLESMVSGDPAVGYFKSSTATDMFGTTQEEVETVYVLPEDGEYMVYTHDSMMDEWEVDSDYDEEYQNKMSKMMDFGFLSDIGEDGLTLAKETETVNDHDTYVLTATVPGKLLDQLGMDTDDMDLDISKLSLPVTIYVDTESFLPVRLDVETEFMKDLFMEQYADSMEGAMEGATLDVSFENFVRDYSYDNVQIPPLPEEALENIAMSEYDPQQADGSFIIFDDGVAARIVCTDGWEGMALDHNYIMVCDEEYNYFIDFTLYPAMSEDELVKAMLEDAFIYDENSTALSPIGNYEVVLYGEGEDTCNYFAYTRMGDGWLVVYAYTFDNEDMIPILEAVLPMAAEYPYDQVDRPAGEPDEEVTLTAEEVLNKLIEATDKENSRQCVSTCEMVFEFVITEDGTSEDAQIYINIDTDVIVSADPFAGYTYGDISMAVMDHTQNNTVTLYVVEEDGALVSYTQSNGGEWERSDATEENRERIAGGTSFHFLTDSELSLEDSLETIDGKQMYVLYCTISGSQLQNYGFDPASLLGDNSGTAAYPTALYIDAETFLPAYAWIDVSEMVEALEASFTASMGASDPQELEMSPFCDGYFVEFTYGVPTPEVPAEANNG